MKLTLPLLFVIAVIAPPQRAVAQEEKPPTCPYANQLDTASSGLTAEETAQLRNGEGMGQARAAELNHYPGPKHVLDHADTLELTDDQKQQARQIFETMHQDAVRIGESIIEKEGNLARRFQHQHIDSGTLRTLTAEIAELRGQLRFAHLGAHLAMSGVLSDEQTRRYDMLRGHTGETSEHSH